MDGAKVAAGRQAGALDRMGRTSDARGRAKG